MNAMDSLKLEAGEESISLKTFQKYTFSVNLYLALDNIYFFPSYSGHGTALDSPSVFSHRGSTRNEAQNQTWKVEIGPVFIPKG